MKITAPPEWIDECTEELINAKREVATQLYKKYGNSVYFPMFLHVDLCNAMHAILSSAPDRKEGLRFIRQALKEVKEKFNGEE